MSTLKSNINPLLTALGGLIFHWDFTGEEPMRSKGRYFGQLYLENDRPEFSAHGAVASSSLVIRGSQTLKIKLSECPEIELLGANRQLTVIGWIKVPRGFDPNEHVKYKRTEKMDWCFVCKVINPNGIGAIMNFLADDYKNYSPFDYANKGTDLRQGEILINIPTGFHQDDPVPFSMLSGLTLYNRALSRHEIKLIYHHM